MSENPWARALIGAKDYLFPGRESPESALGQWRASAVRNRGIAQQFAQGQPVDWGGREAAADPMLNWIGVGNIKAVGGLPMGPHGFKAYHGSLNPNIDEFAPYSHFGDQAAANKRLADVLELPPQSRPYSMRGQDSPTVYPVEVTAKNPIDLPDLGDWTDAELSMELFKKGLIDEKTLTAAEEGLFDPWEFLKSKGHDAIRYSNTFEGKGEPSWVVFDPKSQVKSQFQK